MLLINFRLVRSIEIYCIINSHTKNKLIIIVKQMDFSKMEMNTSKIFLKKRIEKEPLEYCKKL